MPWRGGFWGFVTWYQYRPWTVATGRAYFEGSGRGQRPWEQGQPEEDGVLGEGQGQYPTARALTCLECLAWVGDQAIVGGRLW